MSASLEAHVGIAFERGVVLAPRTLVVILRLRLISYIYVLVTLMIYFFSFASTPHPRFGKLWCDFSGNA